MSQYGEEAPGQKEKADFVKQLHPGSGHKVKMAHVVTFKNGAIDFMAINGAVIVFEKKENRIKIG